MNSPIRPKIELAEDFMAVLITCKSDEDPIKKNRYRPDNISRSLRSPQGRITLMPVVESGPKSNLS